LVVKVEAETEAMGQVLPNWQGEVINGVYSLRRLLYGSDHSAVFLTECTAQALATAAVKIVPAERVTLAQLAYWRTAADLTHPHLIRLLDAGLWQREGRQFLFVVMEYAEQTLSELLVQRALTAEEVQEMLPATLDTLAFLHRQNLVQGQLKPANFLVVGDQLKLASDTIRPAGEPRASVAVPSPYDPPEAEGGRLSPAGDIWALGITLVEALTQRLPGSPDAQTAAASLLTSVPPTLADTVQRCLNQDPARRPTASDLEAQLKGKPPQPPAAVLVPQAVLQAVAQVAVPEAPAPAAPPEEPRRPRLLTPAIAMVFILVVVWGGMRVLQHPETTVSARAEVAAKPAPPLPVSALPRQPAPPSADAPPAVVHEEIPVVPRSARETISGHIKVAVLVSVDASGNVTDARMETFGPSRYFARLAKEAAKEWKFAPADNPDSRKCLLRFEFARGGTTGRAVVKK
jgi:TonB family protein